MQAKACKHDSVPDNVKEWKRCLSAAMAVLGAAGEPHGKFVAAQLGMHSMAVSLREEHSRWLSLGKTTALRLKADRSGQSLDAVVKALASLSAAVENAATKSLKLPSPSMAPHVKSELSDQADFGELDDARVSWSQCGNLSFFIEMGT